MIFIDPHCLAAAFNHRIDTDDVGPEFGFLGEFDNCLLPGGAAQIRNVYVSAGYNSFPPEIPFLTNNFHIIAGIYLAIVAPPTDAENFAARLQDRVLGVSDV